MSTKRSKQLVIKRIRALHRAGKLWGPSQAPQNLRYKAAYYFGGWFKAVKAAGINYKSVKQSARDRRRKLVLKSIQALHRAGKPLDNLRADINLRNAACSCWGSWAVAVRAAGIDYKSLKQAAIKQRFEASHGISWTKLERLFREPALRFTDIADKLGVSKQRVSQIYRYYFSTSFPHRSGNQRLRADTENRLRQRLAKLMSTPPSDRYQRHVTRKAQAVGLGVEFLATKNKRLCPSASRLHTGRLLINGKMCAILHSTNVISNGRLVAFSSLVPKKVEFKICILDLKSGKLTFVIPSSLCREFMGIM